MSQDANFRQIEEISSSCGVIPIALFFSNHPCSKISLWPEKEILQLTRAHYFISNVSEANFFLPLKNTEKKTSQSYINTATQSNCTLHCKTHLYTHFSPAGNETQGGECKVTLAGSRTSWWVRILNGPWLGPTCFCLYLLCAALGLVLSVQNGNEPSYFWALLCVCRQTWRPLAFFTQDRTLFHTKRASKIWNLLYLL